MPIIGTSLRVGQKLIIMLGTLLGILLYIYADIGMMLAVSVSLIFIAGGYLTLKYGGGKKGKPELYDMIKISLSVLIAGAGPIILLFSYGLFPRSVLEESLLISVLMAISIVAMVFIYTPEE